MELDNTLLERYSRQILVDDIGYDGQVRLLNHRVTIQGPPQWMHLAGRYLQAAGVGVSYHSGEPSADRIRIHLETGEMDDFYIPLDVSEDSAQIVTTMGLALSQLLLMLVHKEVRR
ncbi:hypothetical protein [Sulfobacillus thermosulfidooxidans]|uniref:hypothetical protein n=1 Tax=Sulfobacillus thermosulfidooxidans TaxID=28034 RepID=UPI00031E2244|nr:hypothetical protein [Sulfobacillus thermosulfidooxidans]